ncbi:MAG: hypothetical protein SOZ51_07655 [Eubacteriales bacterium]|nr:hypothetical protein [Eubacteriales bacterium]
MKRSKKEKKILPPEDDGRTVVNMNVEGFSWYQPNLPEKKKKNDPDKPTRKETLAMIRAAYRTMLPYALIAIGGLVLAFVAGALWLK